jgi:hypothetical protein
VAGKKTLVQPVIEGDSDIVTLVRDGPSWPMIFTATVCWMIWQPEGAGTGVEAASANSV